MILFPKKLLVLSVLMILTLSACSGSTYLKKPKPLTGAPIPDAENRLEYKFASDDTTTVIERALRESVCLVQSDLIDACKSYQNLPDLCTHALPQKQVETLYAPLFNAIPSIKLTGSPPAIKIPIENKIPEAWATLEVYDARRAYDCTEWIDKTACVAIKYYKLWVVLYAPDDDGIIDHFEVFRAVSSTCSEAK